MYLIIWQVHHTYQSTIPNVKYTQESSWRWAAATNKTQNPKYTFKYRRWWNWGRSKFILWPIFNSCCSFISYQKRRTILAVHWLSPIAKDTTLNFILNVFCWLNRIWVLLSIFSFPSKKLYYLFLFPNWSAFSTRLPMRKLLNWLTKVGLWSWEELTVWW